MYPLKLKRFQRYIILFGFLLLLSVIPAVAGLNDLFGKKEVDETERKETIEKIDSIQEKLKLLQDKLRALERRKAAKEAAQRADGTTGAISATPVQINWQPIDETTLNPGEFGLYTYLLFKGELADSAAVGSLEDFILTIETLPDNDIPVSLANRFLIPVEKPQSMVSLGRQPYDFKLNAACLDRLGLQDNLPDGPVLVSMRGPLDPYGLDEVPAFLAVSLGRQTPQRALELARIWHQQEKDALVNKEVSQFSELFWEIIDGAGPTRVARYQQRIMVELPQQ
ncbi:MAG: hypothetical protein IH613_09180 [Desulfuromonadales bacterium]|nr:hypothetical protein [Desulfuromonadales bacterium]